jgi:hypothetical protein
MPYTAKARSLNHRELYMFDCPSETDARITLY